MPMRPMAMSYRAVSVTRLRADPHRHAADRIVTAYRVPHCTRCAPEALENGLDEAGEEREKASTPIRARIDVVDGLLADNQRQLDRLLDLYLAGDLSREALTDRKARLEATILSLEKERIGLIAHLEQQILSAEQIQSIREFAAQVRQNLDAMSSDPDAKRRLIESLDVRAVLSMQDGQAIVHASCVLYPEETVLNCVPEHNCYETARKKARGEGGRL